MAGREIYPTSVFENQTNGTVFYREGKLNDPMMPNQAGVFESWRYSFDSGRQVFKANGTDKVYEKRLIKDKNGNPHWSDWMEICPGEAHGIQAIAINDRPLLLPNEDGAIKLQITPQMIDTYTKREIYDLVSSKISEFYTDNYIYVSWIPGCETAEEVINQTFSEGGEFGRYYLVEPKPEKNKSNPPSYFIWDEDTAQQKNKFIELKDLPDIKAFVSYSAFKEHTEDESLHTTAEEKQAIENRFIENENAIAELRNDIEAHSVRIDELAVIVSNHYDELLSKINTHINDVGDINSPHISEDERKKLNSIFSDMVRMPSGTTDRYVVQNEKYELAYEQTVISDDEQTQIIFEAGSKAYQHGGKVIDLEDNILSQINTITSANNIITELKLELNGVSIVDANGDKNWRLVDDHGWFTSWNENNAGTILLPLGDKIPNIIEVRIDSQDESARVMINSVKLYAKYKSRLGVQIGDSSKKLGLNLVGPENAIPTYNGIPLNEITTDAANTAEWGKIHGNIELQTDLARKIAEAVSSKINHGDLDSHLRFDVYRDGVIKSVIQQIDKSEDYVVPFGETSGKFAEGAPIIQGIQNEIRELANQGYIVYATSFEVENISVYQDEETHKPIPVWFETDNSTIRRSPMVIGPFKYNWPGESAYGTAQIPFDTIYLKGGNAEYITNAKFVIKCIKYGDVTVSLYDDLAKKYYNIKIEADELKEIAEKLILESNGDFEISSKNGNGKISTNGILSLGGTEYEYGASKVGVDDNPVDQVHIYGQEADERYAGKDNFDDFVETINVRVDNEVTTLNNRIDDEVSQLNDTIAEKEETLSERINENTESISAHNDRLNSLETSVNDIQSTIEADHSAFELYKGEVESKFNDVAEAEDALRAEVDTKVTETVNRIASYDETLSEAINQSNTAVSTLTAVVDIARQDISNLQNETEDIRETYATKEELRAVSTEDLENFDLTINNSDELTQSIINHSFENAERILFKKGSYVLNTNDRNIIETPIDFSNIKYIKGEYPAKVTLNKDGQVAPLNVENVKFENISFVVGTGTEAFEIDDGERVMSIKANGKTVIRLNENYSTYKVLISSDAELKLENAASNKEYKLYIDQTADVHKVSFTNMFENGYTELVTNGLENQQSNKRTLIKLISDNKTNKDEFIVEEIIYGLVNNPSANETLNVVYEHVEHDIYGTSVPVEAVDCSRCPTFTQSGVSLTLAPTIKVGYAHSKTGKDYKVSIEGGKVLGYGKCDEETTFDIPYGIQAIDDNGTMPKIIVDFENVEPQFARIVLDSACENYVEIGSRQGFVDVQTYYGTASVGLEMKKDFYMYRLECDDTSITNGYNVGGLLPWEFIPSPRENHENYVLTITPKFYARFSDFSIETVSPYPFDKSKVALVGTNTFNINGFVSSDVKADPNYGVLYTQAPVSYVDADDGEETINEDLIDGEVSLVNNGKAQEGNFNFDEAVIGKNINLNFTIAGEEDKTIVKQFYIGNINGTDGIITIEGSDIDEDGKVLVHTIVNENKAYIVRVDYQDSAINDFTGTWTNSNGAVVSISNGRSVDGHHEMEIRALAKGKATLTFRNNFTGLSKSIDVYVVTHAKSVECTNVTTAAEKTITPEVKFLDYNDVVIEDKNKISNTNFVYTNETDSLFLNVEEGTNIKITNASFDDKTVVEVPYSIQSEDSFIGPKEVTPGIITITPAEYLITYKISEDSKIIGHSIYGSESASSDEILKYNRYAKGGQVLNIIITLEDNVRLSNANIDAISEAFGGIVSVKYNKLGKFSAIVNMPYNDVYFELN